MHRTLATLLITTLFPLQSALSQVVSPCPDEAETQQAGPGRSKKVDTCATFSWTFSGDVGAGGTIYVVDASVGVGGTVTLSSVTECAYEASDFSDEWSKCEGETKVGAWCEDEAYQVIEKVWTTKEISPCPEFNVWDYIIQVVTTGRASMPGCDPLLPAPNRHHQSAQQHDCSGDDPWEGSAASGQYTLTEGDPRLSLGSTTGAVGAVQLQAILDLLGPDDLASHPVEVQQLAADYPAIQGEALLFATSEFTRYGEVGEVEYSVERTISGTFRSDGTYSFSCPQVALEEGTARSKGFLEEWTRDAEGLYRWTSGNSNGLAIPVQGGGADEVQALHYPEVDMIQDWLVNPFPLNHSSSMAYVVDHSVPDVTKVSGAVKANKYLNQSSVSMVLAGTDATPVSVEYFTSAGMPFLVTVFTNYALVTDSDLRPHRMIRQVLDPATGALVASWDVSISVGDVEQSFGDPFSPPRSSSGRWFVRN